eukprot:Amastigsp_a677609_14.p4 type:complete len:192 gc:universal Amastigsp_a677609_14:906-1481(+)
MHEAPCAQACLQALVARVLCRNAECHARACPIPALPRARRSPSADSAQRGRHDARSPEPRDRALSRVVDMLGRPHCALRRPTRARARVELGRCFLSLNALALRRDVAETLFRQELQGAPVALLFTRAEPRLHGSLWGALARLIRAGSSTCTATGTTPRTRARSPDRICTRSSAAQPCRRATRRREPSRRRT